MIVVLIMYHFDDREEAIPLFFKFRARGGNVIVLVTCKPM